MSFDKCVIPDFIRIQSISIIPEFLCASWQSVPAPPLVTTDPLSVPRVSLLDFCIGGVIEHVVFWVRLLSFSIVLLRFVHALV